VPGCRLANWYVPDSLVDTVETMPVCVFVAVTVTLGTKAPDESVAVPPNVPLLDCVNVTVGKNRQSNTA